MSSKSHKSMFTRRQYGAIAAMIAEAKQSVNSVSELNGIAIVQRNLAELFAQDNHSFNRPKFLDACGRSSGKEAA